MCGAQHPTGDATLDDCVTALTLLSTEAVEEGWTEPLRTCVDRWLDCRQALSVAGTAQVMVPNLSRG